MRRKKMKIRLVWLVNVFLVLAFILAGCGQTTSTPVPIPPLETTEAPVTPVVTQAPTTTVAAEEEPIYLAIIWHQHQPVYFKDPDTGIYAKPWVRVHATKDYVDMAAILKQYPSIQATFNITPSLIRQIDDLEAGAKDLYWVMSEIPADQLTDEEKQFLLDRFFDTNRQIIARFPRYQELLNLRDGNPDSLNTYTMQDYLDLQVLFNLAWTDPDWLEQEPLSALVAKGSGFEEADKLILFEEHQRLISQVIPIHKELQDAGQIEVTMTPFAHPILPLLVNTDLARVAIPDIDLGGVSFAYGADAVEQVQLGVDLYQEHFGQAPRGMWPAEGSVAQMIVTMVSQAGIKWMASDEGVLANSLGIPNFTRDAQEVITQPDQLYRPYYVQGVRGDPVAIVFRDRLISDKVGFTYSGQPGALAAKDFISRIHAIREALLQSGAEGPHLVSVILDGENAWEYYENDGKEFLHSLYQGLSDDPLIKTVTPSQFLERAPDQPKIDELWAGSWINADYSTWIGEGEENRAWSYLARTRDMLQKYITGARQISPENLQQAMALMYIAEGSDWFWWYGADQDSGDDGSFDRQFLDTLKQVYIAVGEKSPTYLDVPIIPQRAVSADQASKGLISPTIDGLVEADEWEAAGVYLASGGAMAAADPFFESLAYGFDSQNLYLNFNGQRNFDSITGKSSIEVYLAVPGSGGTNNFSRNGTLLGFPANRMLAVEFDQGQPVRAELYSGEEDEKWAPNPETVDEFAASDASLEVAVPLALLGNPDTGDRISLRAVYDQIVDLAGKDTPVDAHLLPGSGPASLSVPDLGTTAVLLNIDDPSNDDRGPGTYTYPSDAVFAGGNYDILNFQVGYDADNVVFKFTMRGPVENAWGSPNGLSVQTFDVYIDQDGGGAGEINFLPGRNLALQEGFAWDYAVTIEGWEAGIFTPGEGGPEKLAASSQFSVLIDAGQQKVTIRIPKSILGEDPENWRYSAMVLGQEGYPSGGVMRVRDVSAVSEQWRFGGAPAGATNHTRVIDLVWPVQGEQEAWLGDFTISNAPQGQLTGADFAKVPMLVVE
jgi:alpha-amylase/alpha-mannosidase (GH57 family)